MDSEQVALTPAQQAAKLLGTLGGHAGKGKSKKRGSKEYYRRLALKSAKTRREAAKGVVSA